MIRYPGRQQGEAFQESLCWEAAGVASLERLQELAKVGGSVAIEVARNPSTPALLLEELSRSQDPLVRGALLQNPKTPRRVLSEILASSSKWILRAAVSYIHDEKLLQSAEVKLRSLAVSVKAQKTLAQNIDTPLIILNQIGYRFGRYARQARRDIIEAAKENPALLLPYSQKLKERKEPWLETELAVIASDAKSPPALLVMIATLGSVNLPYYLARNPSTPQTLLEELAGNPAFSMNIASNPSTPQSIIEALSRQKMMQVSIAFNPAAPTALLDRLAKEADNESLLYYIAQHKNTSLETLTMIAGKTNDGSLINFLLNSPLLQEEALRALAQKRNLTSYQKTTIVNHPKATTQMLLFLELDAGQVEVNFASKPNTAPELLAQLARDPRLQRSSVMPNLLKHPNLPVEVLVEFTNQRRIRMEDRIGIAQNPNAPAEVLDILAAELGSSLRELIAKHPNTSKETLQFLAKSKVGEIRDVALQRLESRS